MKYASFPLYVLLHCATTNATGLEGSSPTPKMSPSPPIVKHTGPGSGGELCKIFNV